MVWKHSIHTWQILTWFTIRLIFCKHSITFVTLTFPSVLLMQVKIALKSKSSLGFGACTFSKFQLEWMHCTVTHKQNPKLGVWPRCVVYVPFENSSWIECVSTLSKPHIRLHWVPFPGCRASAFSKCQLEWLRFIFLKLQINQKHFF